jgi:hypothetical protein
MAKNCRATGRGLLFAALIALLPACAERTLMMVPPRFDLGQYERIGVVEVTCADRELQEQATRQFQELLLDARPGTAVIVVVDGGSAGTRSGELDPAAIRSLAEQNGLDAVFTGELKMSGIKPTIGISSSLVELNTRSEIVGTMSARLVEPTTGATLWIRTADERATVASGAINSEGSGSFGMTDPEAVKRELVGTLVSQVTHDFRPQYLRKRVDDIPPGYRATYPDGVEVYVPPETAVAQH